MKFYKYHGAGNDFLLADNREGTIVLASEQVRRLCDRHTGFGADGVMLLSPADGYDFRMEYWNPDGSTGMMCGNGGRCIVAFAYDLGIRSFNFLAPDGPHKAEILSKEGEVSIVRLGMKDVTVCDKLEDGYFLDTGTRHFVRFVEDVDKVDIAVEGPRFRHDPRFAPVGTNVNFVSLHSDGSIRVRTFEKGVEGETLACGTGIVASAMASYLKRVSVMPDIGTAQVTVHARIATLSVSFRREGKRFTDVQLTGPAERVGIVEPAWQE